MSNSYESAVLELYTGIFADIRVALPSIVGLGRCAARLSFTHQTRGWSYLTIDLPAFGKHFDKCLSTGVLTPTTLPTFGQKLRGTNIPKFLSGLFELVFDSDGKLLSQPNILAIFFLRQLFYAAKKLRLECKDTVREQSLRNYIHNELSLRDPYLNWYDHELDTRCGRSLHLSDESNGGTGPNLDPIPAGLCDTVHDVADRVFTRFGLFDPTEWRPKHGPGAIADGTGKTYKYNFPTWSARLEASFPSDILAHTNYGTWADDVRVGRVPTEKEVPSVALTVPKSQKGPRIIAKEPAANMWCQQIIRDYLESKTQESPLRNCISFRDQSLNQQAALEASKTGKAWTVDLKDASDRLTLWLVERLVRKNPSLLAALHSSRSQYCKVPTKDGGELIRMKKFAPQGSATTFPLQTIVYAILAISSVIYAKGERVSTKTIGSAASQVRVFGDDTVIPDFAGGTYVSLLTYCGFLVNTEKTYSEGNFRESCGYEAYDGVDVTPAYIVNPYDEFVPSSVASTVECSNNFYKKGFWHAAASLESTLPHWVRQALRVVRIGDGTFGLTSFMGSYTGHLVMRENNTLWRKEVRALSLIVEVPRTQPNEAGHLLQYFTERPTPDVHWISGLDGRPISRVVRRWEALDSLSN